MEMIYIYTLNGDRKGILDVKTQSSIIFKNLYESSETGKIGNKP